MPGMPAAGADTSGVPLDRSESRRLGITFARAAERPVRPRAGGRILKTRAQPRVRQRSSRCWVEQLYADYVGKRVEQGDPLLALYSPDL